MSIFDSNEPVPNVGAKFIEASRITSENFIEKLQNLYDVFGAGKTGRELDRNGKPKNLWLCNSPIVTLQSLDKTNEELKEGLTETEKMIKDAIENAVRGINARIDEEVYKINDGMNYINNKVSNLNASINILKEGLNGWETIKPFGNQYIPADSILLRVNKTLKIAELLVIDLPNRPGTGIGYIPAEYNPKSTVQFFVTSGTNANHANEYRAAFLTRNGLLVIDIKSGVTQSGSCMWSY
jgi:hypothetical protein